MFTKRIIRNGFILSMMVLVLASCRKREAELPDNYAVFETSAQGISANETSITVKVKLSRGVNGNVPVIINVTEQGIVDGTDYTIVPAATAGKISLTVPSGNNEASFTLTKKTGALFDGDEKIVFDLYSTGESVLIGVTKKFTLSFGELVSSASTAVVNGGGANYPNKVFIDLSANRQTPVLRTAWDLGFYTGGDDFRVILNSSSAMMAKQINKNDLNAVSATDTIGFCNDVVFSQAAPTVTSLAYIDYPSGDLTKTAITSIAATSADNKIYIINRGTGVGNPAPDRGWRKIRIIRNASGGYTLQHADIAATTFSSVDISKDDAYFFKYISFESGAAAVEPAKKKWDITWTYFSNVTNFGTGEVPYLFQDIVLINRNVQVAKVMVATKAFTDFAETDIAAQTFLTAQNSIASDWRSGGGPGVSPAVRTDRYYIIKDGDNNYYKIRFTALTQNGERGYPAYESVLVKKG